MRAEQGLRHRKRAAFGRFTIDCDEDPRSVGRTRRCAHQQVSEAREILVEQAVLTVTAEYDMLGSILFGTAEHPVRGVETRLELQSPVPAEAVATLVTQAERMCFVLDALRRPHAVTRRLLHTGDPLAHTRRSRLGRGGWRGNGDPPRPMQRPFFRVRERDSR